MNEMTINQFVGFINTAYIKERDEKIFAQWCARLPRFTEPQYLDFNYFKSCVTGENIDRRSAEDILADTETAMKEAGIE